MSALLTRRPFLLNAEVTNVIAPIGIACNGDQWATMTTVRHHTRFVPDLWRCMDRRKRSTMKVLTVIIVAAGVLYLLDSQYNGGRYLDLLTQLARHISAAFGFAW
jgi:hypothetical protein